MDKDYKTTDKKVINESQTMQQFIGRWKFVRKQNFDEFLAECGIPYLLRKTANALTPTEVIEALKSSSDEFCLRWALLFYSILCKTLFMACSNLINALNLTSPSPGPEAS